MTKTLSLWFSAKSRLILNKNFPLTKQQTEPNEKIFWLVCCWISFHRKLLPIFSPFRSNIIEVDIHSFCFLQQRAISHTETVSREIKASFENKVRAGIGKSYLSDKDFFNLFANAKQSSLEEVCFEKPFYQSIPLNNRIFCSVCFQGQWRCFQSGISTFPWISRARHRQSASDIETGKWGK